MSAVSAQSPVRGRWQPAPETPSSRQHLNTSAVAPWPQPHLPPSHEQHLQPCTRQDVSSSSGGICACWGSPTYVPPRCACWEPPTCLPPHQEELNTALCTRPSECGQSWCFPLAVEQCPSLLGHSVDTCRAISRSQPPSSTQTQFPDHHANKNQKGLAQVAEDATPTPGQRLPSTRKARQGLGQP